jgi:hypothetical protein
MTMQDSTHELTASERLAFTMSAVAFFVGVVAELTYMGWLCVHYVV